MTLSCLAFSAPILAATMAASALYHRPALRRTLAERARARIRRRWRSTSRTAAAAKRGITCRPYTPKHLPGGHQ